MAFLFDIVRISFYLKISVNTEKKDSEDHITMIGKDFTKLEIWTLIPQNYEMIQDVQLSNSFIILMTLDKAEEKNL
jgi:hypothetical protein